MIPPAQFDRKTLGSRCRLAAEPNSQSAIQLKGSNAEGGYAMVALLVVMSLRALLARAAT